MSQKKCDKANNLASPKKKEYACTRFFEELLMTNKSSSKQHGLQGRGRPSKKQRFKENKAKLRPAQAARQQAIAEAMANGNQ